ncbi:hypothetical protein [Morganella morganii]|uniref:hypothetical protein n=1 Tax=Morganella morganii TaxID=582 RepID=UPI0020158C67|nr:hypothetical protein [Morganella morganii]
MTLTCHLRPQAETVTLIKCLINEGGTGYQQNNKEKEHAGDPAHPDNTEFNRFAYKHKHKQCTVKQNNT